MQWWMYVGAGIVLLAGGLVIGYAYRKNVAEAKIAKAEDAVKKLYEEATVKAAEIKKSVNTGDDDSDFDNGLQQLHKYSQRK